MIERLDSHNQPLFTTVEGRQPYFHKWVTPIARVRYADTVFNVRSQGIQAHWFPSSDGIDNARSTSYSGKVPIIKFWYGAGQPEVFVNEQPEEWAVEYTGYFYAPITANYTFYFAGDGKIDSFQVSSTTRLNVSSSRAKMGLQQVHAASCEPFSLNNGWTRFNLKYKKPVDNKNAGFIAFWKTDSASVTPNRIPLSAGVLNSSQPLASDTPYPVSWSTVTGFNAAQLSIEKDKISTFKFQVPFVSTSSYNYNGFRYVSTTDSYEKVSSSFGLKKYRMIEYSEGFRDSDGNDQFVVRFTGQIRDFRIAYDKSGNDKINVECQDYGIFTRDAINLTDPSPIDYWEAGYTEVIPGHVNGQSKPRAFDGWEVHKAYQVMLTNSYIDPWSSYQREIRNNSNDTAAVGEFNIQPINSSVVSYLPTREKYGNPNVVQREDKDPDEEYLYKIATGEYYQDAINDMFKPWSYSWGINRYGNPFLKRREVPSKVFGMLDFNYKGSMTTSDIIDLDQFKGSYRKINSGVAAAGFVASARAIGSRFDLLLPMSPELGHETLSTTNIKVHVVDQDGTTLRTVEYNQRYDTSWGFYKGPDRSNGVNPTIKHVGINLDYDEYVIKIENLSAVASGGKPAALMGVNGLLVYDRDLNNPDEYFYTGDVTTSGSIISLQTEAPTKDQRTDAIVLGSLQGTKLGDENFSPNNPILTYVQSSSRDLNSVYVSTSKNYVGRPRIVIIQDPKVNTQEQADHISFNTVDQFSSPSKNISLTVAGHPKIDIDDKISVNDDAKYGVDSTNSVWVTGFVNTFDQNGFKTQIKTTPIKPIASYWDKVAPDTTNFPHPIFNVRLHNQGMFLTDSVNGSGLWFSGVSLTQTLNISSSTAWVGTNVSWLPKQGYFDISQFSAFYQPPYYFFYKERVKYTGVHDNGSGGYALTGLIRNITDESARKNFTAPSDRYTDPYDGAFLNIGWDPYTSEGLGIVPYITFDIAKSGNIQVKVKSKVDHKNQIGAISNDVPVDTLTDVDGKSWPKLAYEHLTWGKNKKYTWGGMDNFTDYNVSVPTDALVQGGVYVKDSMIGLSDGLRETQALTQSNTFRHYKPLSKGINPKFTGLSYGKFYFEITFEPDDGSGTVIIRTDTDTAGVFYNYDDVNHRYVTTNLSDVPTFDLWFSTSGMKRWNHQTETMSNYASTYPHIDRAYGNRTQTSNAYNKVDPVFITNTSNANRGLKFFVQQVDTVVARIQDQHTDSINMNDMLREVSFQALNFKIRNYHYFTHVSPYDPATWKHGMSETSFNIREHLGNTDNDYEFYSTPVGFFFNFNLIEEDGFGGIPANVRDSWSRYTQQYSKNEHQTKMNFFNIVYPIGEIVDRSGRAVKDARQFKTRVAPNGGPDGMYDYTPHWRPYFNLNLTSLLSYMRLPEILSSGSWYYDTNSKIASTAHNHGWYTYDDPISEETLSWAWSPITPIQIRTVSFRPGFFNDEAQYYFLRNRGLLSTSNSLDHREKNNYVYWIDTKLNIRPPYTSTSNVNDIRIQPGLYKTFQGAGSSTEEEVYLNFRTLLGDKYFVPCMWFQLRGYPK